MPLSRATTYAWYNSPNTERLKLVAAYFGLNAIFSLAVAAQAFVKLVDGAGAPANGIYDLIAGIMALCFSTVWVHAARLLWNARKDGAYWAIGLTVLAVLQWLFSDRYLLGLLFDLVPLVLVAMSWSALKSDGTIDPR